MTINLLSIGQLWPDWYKFDWHLGFDVGQCLQILLMYMVYLPRNSSEKEEQEKIVFDHMTLIKIKGKFIPVKRLSHANRW